MKFSVSSYSYGKYQTEEGFEWIINKTAELGFDGIEFTDGMWRDNLDLEIAKKVKACCDAAGLEVVAYTIGADFLKNGREATVEKLKQQVDFAEALGAKMMRHDTTYGYTFNERKHGIGFDNAIPEMVDGIREVTEYAQSKGIKTMTENHGHFAQDALRVEKLINAVNHPNFGALVDIGNFMCADEDPTLSVGIMAPYAFHVHAKDFYWKSGIEIDPGEGWGKTRACNRIRGAIIGHGSAKVYQSIQALKRVGYDAYLSIEYEGKEDPVEGIRQGLANLKRFAQ